MRNQPDDAFVVTSVLGGRHGLDRFMAANPAIAITRAVIANPHAIDRSTLVAERIIAAENRFDAEALAGALIHASLWRECTGSGRVLHIADSRVILRFDFAAAIAPHVRAPDGFDIVVWSYDLCEPVDIGLAPGIEGRLIHNTTNPAQDDAAFRNSAAPPLAFRLRRCGPPFGYTLSPAGAGKLLALCLPFSAASLVYFGETGQPVRSTGYHAAMAGHYAALRAFVLQPVLALAPPDPAGSSAVRHFLDAYNAFVVEHARATPIRWVP